MRGIQRWRSLVAQVAALVLVVLTGCDKAPPEPSAPGAAAVTTTPSGSLATAIAPAAPKDSPRTPQCVRPLSAKPPPPPVHAVDPKCPADPSGGSPMVPVGHIFLPESKDAPTLEVELMRTEGEQARGLMYRRALADDKGMLFAWRSPSVHSFWMHNTCIPLDMLFIDGDGFIAGIVENAPTLNDEGRSIDCPVRYVLEVAAGWSRRHGVAPGQRVRIEGVNP